jgi:hypothetical protein
MMEVTLPKAELTFQRSLELADDGVVCFSESVHNCAATDRPIGWTQHVTLGAPFLERGNTRFLVSATRSKVYERPFNDGLGMQVAGAEFDWPLCLKSATNDPLYVRNVIGRKYFIIFYLQPIVH